MAKYFIIKGISDIPELQPPFFFLVLLLYLISLGGNLTILLLVCLDHQLHTPMYFFLCNLSILDMSISTVTLHKVLVIFVTGNNKISFMSCISQLYFFSCFTTTELLILTAMSYDRYVAICHPLHYHMLMNYKTCVLLAAGCWVLGFLEMIPYVILILDFSCYKSNIINHFFCDIMPFMKLSCSDTTNLEILIFTDGIFLISVTPFLLTFSSYVFIIVAILRISSNTRRYKIFYACSSHLTVVTLLYMTLFFQYLTPTSMGNLDFNKMFSFFNTAVIPILNPLIYSLKNKDVKLALLRTIQCF
ncbi:olfactory receptor 5AR1-like [Rhinophrynus dorsalis]